MIPFLNGNRYYLILSSVMIAISIAAITILGFRYSVEFVGGSQLAYELSGSVDRDQIEQTLADQELLYEEIMITDDTELAIRTQVLSEQEEEQLREAIAQSTGSEVTVLRVETVGPSLSTDNLIKTAIAVGLGVIGILAYVWFAFRNGTYAIGAIVALFHDILILIGSYALVSYFLGAELDTLFVTAALTTMSFSVHDTIVMFDQMRMYRRIKRKEDPEIQANRAIGDTIMRSINNSLTIVFMLVALMLLGGDSIRFFAFALLIGTVIGTYSSPFVSIPIAVWIEKRRRSQKTSA